MRCGIGLQRSDRGYSWSAHHRAPRSMGGTREPWVSKAANGVLLCGTGTTGCHGWVEKHRSEAIAQGWLVSRIRIHVAADIPVLYWDGTVRQLDDDGGYVLAA